MASNKNLSNADVSRLLKDPSDETRALTARKVAAQFQESISPSERAIAEEIFRVMVRDVAVRVRGALADSLKESPDLPHDLALTLANDVSEVALPFIASSDVLSDADLVEIVRTQTKEHQIAVAKRSEVSEAVTEALVDTHHEEVVAAMVANEGAKLNERTMNRVLDEFGDRETVNAPMTKRSTLPITIAERLVTLVSDKLRDHLVTHHELSPNSATDLILDSRERATVGLLESSDRFDAVALAKQLHENGRLTPTLILRSLCMGDEAFFEAGLARLAGIPRSNAYALIHDHGDLGLRSLFRKCGLSEEMLAISRGALRVIAETDYNGEDGDIERFKQRMIERVLTQFEDGFDEENFEYLVAKLGAGDARRGSPKH